jgi:hypothetical protein
METGMTAPPTPDEMLTNDELDNLRWRRHVDDEKGITHPWARDVDRLLRNIAALSATAARYREALEPFAAVAREIDAWCLEMALKQGGTAADAELFVPSEEICYVFGHSGKVRVLYGDLRRAAAILAQTTPQET